MSGPKFDRPNVGPKKGAHGPVLDDIFRFSGADFGHGARSADPRKTPLRQTSEPYSRNIVRVRALNSLFRTEIRPNEPGAGRGRFPMSRQVHQPSRCALLSAMPLVHLRKPVLHGLPLPRQRDVAASLCCLLGYVSITARRSYSPALVARQREMAPGALPPEIYSRGFHGVRLGQGRLVLPAVRYVYICTHTYVYACVDT